MKNKGILINTILLVVIAGNYFRLSSGSIIRTVDFINIFAIGILTGIVLLQISKLLKDKKSKR